MTNAAGAAGPTLTVIMPAYNAAHYLELSLPPLVAMRSRGEIAEVLVVDDCSPDPSNVATAERLGATVVRMERNGGPGAARNFAAKRAVGDILWMIDADVVAHEDGATVVRRAFSDPKVAAVFGSYDDAPPAKNFASQYKNLVHRYYHQRGKADSDTFWSGCGAVRKSIYAELGGFDGARYGRPSIEDIEFGFRMRKAGWSIRLAHDLVCTHLKKWSLPEVVRTDIFQRAVPWSHLILSGRSMSDDLNVSSTERVKAGVAGLWFVAVLASLIPSLQPLAPLAALGLGLAIIALNRDLIGFFRRAKGVPFAVAATLFHQVYYVYSAATFSFCAVAYHLGGKKDLVVPRVADSRQPG
jgi:hypothetical protein